MLTHSTNFQRRFLGLTQFGSAFNPAKTYVEIQKHHFCDLLVTSHDNSTACVIEFKVDSELMNHQDPTKTDFVRARKGTKSGYGVDMAALLKGFSRLEYVVVANLRQFENCHVRVRGRVIHCRSIAWGDLTESGQAEEPLEKDLFDSLGELGIRAFSLRNLKMKNIRQHTGGAVAIYSTLEKVANTVGIKGRNFKLEINRESKGSWFGVNLPANLKGFAQSRKFTATGVWGWFGYEEVNKQPLLSVWLYSTPEKRLELARYLRKRSEVEWNRDGNTSDFIHRDTVDAGQTDDEWFLNVIEPLKD